MYVNEVRLDTEIRPELDIEAPQVFGAGSSTRRDATSGPLWRT